MGDAQIAKEYSEKGVELMVGEELLNAQLKEVLCKGGI